MISSRGTTEPTALQVREDSFRSRATVKGKRVSIYCVLECRIRVGATMIQGVHLIPLHLQHAPNRHSTLRTPHLLGISHSNVMNHLDNYVRWARPVPICYPWHQLVIERSRSFSQLLQKRIHFNRMLRPRRGLCVNGIVSLIESAKLNRNCMRVNVLVEFFG